MPESTAAAGVPYLVRWRAVMKQGGPPIMIDVSLLHLDVLSCQHKR